jgi:hypothetical protein
MIVRVSARGQANGSADGYLCAREQLGQAERRVRTVGKATFLRVPSVTWFNFGNIDEDLHEIFIGRARRIACRPGRLVGLEATAGAFTGSEVHGCHGTKTMYSSRFVRSLALWLDGGLVGVTLGSEHKHTC